MYGFFGMLISIYGVLVGFLIDRLGVRLALMLGSFLLLGGRLGVAVTHDEAVLEALLLCVLPLGEALGVPVMLVGLRRYTSDENRRQAFALFYVVMNVGVLLSAPAVDVFRLALADGVDVSLHLLGGAYNIHLSAYRLLLLCGFGASVVMLAASTCCLREVDVDRHGRLAAARRRGARRRGARRTSCCARRASGASSSSSSSWSASGSSFAIWTPPSPSTWSANSTGARRLAPPRPQPAARDRAAAVHLGVHAARLGVPHDPRRLSHLCRLRLRARRLADAARRHRLRRALSIGEAVWSPRSTSTAR